jgi:hypothetical protein
MVVGNHERCSNYSEATSYHKLMLYGMELVQKQYQKEKEEEEGDPMDGHEGVDLCRDSRVLERLFESVTRTKLPSEEVQSS